MIHIFKNKSWSNKHYYIFFFVLTFIFYGNSLRNKYALDDNFVTVTNFPIEGRQYVPNNRIISKGFSRIPKIWRSRYVQSKENTYEYRPIVTTTFAIEYAIFKQNPFVSHLVNILIYFFCICVIYNCIILLIPEKKLNIEIAFLCSLLFLIHPIHTEAVDNIKSRDELLSFLFAMLSLIYSLKSYDHNKIKDIILTFLFLLISLLSKRNSIVFIALIPLAVLLTRNFNFKKSLFLLIPFVTFVFFNFFHNFMVSTPSFRSCYHYENPLFTNPETNFIFNVLIALKTYGFYVKSMIWPYPMCFYYGTNTFDINPNINLYTVLSLLFVAGSLIVYYKTKNRLIVLGFFFFSIGISPFLNFRAPVAGVVGDRLAFQASLGFCLLLAIFIKPLLYLKNENKPNINLETIKQNKSILILIAICFAYVFNRNSNWYNGLTLYENDIKHLEKSAVANNILASEYYTLLTENLHPEQAPVLLDKAFYYFKQALKNDSSLFVAAVNVGAIEHVYNHNYEKAIYFYRLSIKHKPTNWISYENIANSYMALGQTDSAATNYQKALKLNSKAFNSITGLKQCIGEIEIEKAIGDTESEEYQ